MKRAAEWLGCSVLELMARDDVSELLLTLVHQYATAESLARQELEANAKRKSQRHGR